jgi:aspartyl-tRNA(Asn)/glutamyl-tRNA(Gln) amidotransferase subunit C
MKIFEKDVEYIAHLSRLEVNPEEKRRIADQLGKILDYMAKLNELDTEDTEPTSHVLPIRNVFREDEAINPFAGVDLMANAPKKNMGHYQVPKILGS